MEHTRGFGKSAEVWVDGTLLRVCDGVSPSGGRLRPGPLEGVRFRTVRDDALDWGRALAGNPSKKITLEPVRDWAYVGYGRVVQIMPVVIDYGLFEAEDPAWSHDDDLIGKFVRVGIDRLEIVPVEDKE